MALIQQGCSESAVLVLELHRNCSGNCAGVVEETRQAGEFEAGELIDLDPEEIIRGRGDVGRVVVGDGEAKRCVVALNGRTGTMVTEGVFAMLQAAELTATARPSKRRSLIAICI